MKMTENSKAPSKQAKVSMVIPCYNKEDFIGATLKSVYNQKWDNIELILVNDASTDGAREIIGQWELRFMERGYTVIIIDCETNNGIPGAVKIGMERVTGDYFCTIDCDDEIYPDYVSAMAGYLEEHPEYEWAACDFECILIKNGEKKVIPKSIEINQLEDPQMLENCLFWRITANIWIYMIRTGYMNKCRVLENYCTEIRSTQEQGIIIPLSVGRGRLKHIREKLYRHHYTEQSTSFVSKYDDVLRFYEVYARLTKRTIETLDVSAGLRRRYSIIAELSYAKHSILRAKTYYVESGYIRSLTEKAAELINKSFTPSPGITPEQIGTSTRAVFAAVENNILGHKYPRIKVENIGGRVIGWGALGKMGQELIPELMETPLQPDVLWDVSAKPDSKVNGIPVPVPDLESLSPDDLVLIFPRYIDVLLEIEKTLDERGVLKHISYYEIIDNLSAYKFPVFYGGCKFEV